MSVLQEAVCSSSIDVIKVFLEEGVNLNSLDDNGKTPLAFAIEKNVEQVVDLLLASGVDVNYSNGDGKTPIHEAILHQRMSILRKLLENGANIEQKFKGFTPLHFAVREDFVSGVELLLANGANANVRDKFNACPAHLAIFLGNEKILELLLENGAELENADGEGQTLLFLAVAENLLSIAELLLIKGARLDAICRGRSVISFAADDDMLKLLMEHFYKVKVLGWDVELKEGYDDKNYPRLENNLGDYLAVYNILCIEEFKKIKAKKIGNFFLSDLFSIGDPSFVVNEQVEEAIESPCLKYDFPIYFRIIKEQFKNARNRLIYLNKAQEALCMNLPEEIKRIVLSYLSNSDLNNVIKASNIAKSA